MKRILLFLVLVLVFALPFVVAQENETFSDFFKEKIENKTGAPILDDTSQTVFTFEEVVTYAVYFIIGLVILVGMWVLYSLLRNRRIKDKKKETINSIK